VLVADCDGPVVELVRKTQSVTGRQAVGADKPDHLENVRLVNPLLGGAVAMRCQRHGSGRNTRNHAAETLGSGWLLVDSLYHEDVVRRARYPRHMFKKSDAPRAGPVRQIELLAFHGLFVGNAIFVVLHDHRAVERSFADRPDVVGRHVRILAAHGTDPQAT
jgi:hypothetical protein